MSFSRTESTILVYTSLVPGEVPPISPDLFKSFWINLIDLKIFTAKWTTGGVLELVTLDLTSLGSIISTIKLPTLITDLQISEGSVTLLGSSFTPPITREPYDYSAIKLEDGSKQDIIEGFTKDADDIHWNPIIAGNQDVLLTNIKITVAC